MKRSKFIVAHIAFALRQADSDIQVEEICRQMGVSQATFFQLQEKIFRSERSRAAQITAA